MKHEDSRGATIDRVIYPSYDSLAVLAAAAGATSRIELMTNILAAPVYPPLLLAKGTACIDQLSGGRLTLGLALGARADDYAAVGQDFHTHPWSGLRQCPRRVTPGVAR